MPNEEITHLTPEQLAKDLLSVQPIDPGLFRRLYDQAIPESELKKLGYEPVEPTGPSLLWIKKNES